MLQPVTSRAVMFGGGGVACWREVVEHNGASDRKPCRSRVESGVDRRVFALSAAV
jgi:hypothetical protein